MFVTYNEDIITSVTYDKIFDNSIELPLEFESCEMDQLRIDEYGNVIDVSDYDSFYICELGEKHIYNSSDESRQLLNCKWNDIIEKDENGNWKVVTLDKLKQEKMLEVYNLRKEKENNGIIVDNFLVDTSETGRVNLSNTINAYAWGLFSEDKTINWKIKSGDFREVGLSDLKKFAAYVSEFIENLFKSEAYHDYNILSLQNIEDINSYDITTNWPQTEYTTT